MDIIFDVRLDYIKDPLVLFCDHCCFLLLQLYHILNNPLKLVAIGRSPPLEQVIFDDLTLKHLIGKRDEFLL
jgi:hypothetical protein